jgi:hypothetical protein
MASLRLKSRILPQSYRWRKSPFGDPAEARSAMMRVKAYSLGWNREAEFHVPIAPHDQRISLEAGIVDRRGVLRRAKGSDHEELEGHEEKRELPFRG